MLIGKILRKSIKKDAGADSSGCVLVVLALMVVAALLLKIFSFATPEKTISLLTSADGLKQLVRAEDISKYSPIDFLLPEENFESELFVIGVYSEKSPSFPKDSIALVYVKNNERFFEIDELTTGSLEEIKNFYRESTREEILLEKDVPGLLIKLRERFDCTNQNGATHPSMCQLTDLLIFEQNNLLIKIFSDGEKLTEGELITLGKSML
jgi:hypothetical protein